MSTPVTVLVTRSVRPGQEQAFEAWLRELGGVAAHYPGHQGVTVIRPPVGEREYAIIFRFDSEDHLHAW